MIPALPGTIASALIEPEGYHRRSEDLAAAITDRPRFDRSTTAAAAQQASQLRRSSPSSRTQILSWRRIWPRCAARRRRRWRARRRSGRRDHPPSAAGMQVSANTGVQAVQRADAADFQHGMYMHETDSLSACCVAPECTQLVALAPCARGGAPWQCRSCGDIQCPRVGSCESRCPTADCQPGSGAADADAILLSTPPTFSLSFGPEMQAAPRAQLKPAAAASGGTTMQRPETSAALPSSPPAPSAGEAGVRRRSIRHKDI